MRNEVDGDSKTVGRSLLSGEEEDDKRKGKGKERRGKEGKEGSPLILCSSFGEKEGRERKELY